MENVNKVKIYKGVVCLEIPSAYGGKWWYQGGTLAYTPVLAEEVYAMRHGTLRDSRRDVLVVAIKIGGEEKLVAINLPRTDIDALKRRGLWPNAMEKPYKSIHYSEWPAYTEGKRCAISLG